MSYPEGISVFLCPNQTIFESRKGNIMKKIKPFRDTGGKLSQEGFLKKLGIPKTFLTFHNLGSYTSEFVEIGMPYMIIHESTDHKRGELNSLEFTESNKNYFFSSTSRLDLAGTRTLHSHDFYELTIVLEGELHLQIENETVTYHAGECCLCNKNIRHKELHDSEFEIILFMFQEEYIKSVLEQDLLYDEEGRSCTNHTFFHHLFSENQKLSFYSAKEYIDFRRKKSFDPDDFYRLINAIVLELSESRSGRNYMVRGYFCRFIAMLGDEENYLIQTHQTRISKEERLFYQVSWLLQNRKGRISRGELEKELNYNSDYINRVIKKYTSQTLSDYSRAFLLKEAAELLKNTDKRVGEICEELGYTNRSHFNRLFIERYGMTPAEYRALEPDAF